MSEQDHCAVITGAGSGIGRATALALAAARFSVVLAGRRVEPLEETRQDIEATGGAALSVCCDVRDEASVVQLFAAAVEKFHRVDVLFNNAGTSAPARRLEELTVAQWNDVVATNLTGLFLCSREAFKVMASQTPQGGRIINNGSISAHAPRPGSAPYTATKHAVTGLTRQCALEGRRYNIACGQIDIGNARTALMEDVAAAGREQPDGTFRPEPTMAPEDVGRAVAYMATLPPEANVLFMTVMATAMPYVGRG